MRRNLLRKEEDNDPMSVVSNLFDVAMVFAVALMVALVSRYSMTEMFSQEDFTMVKNPGKEYMEIITKEGEKINRYTPSEDTSSQSGKKGKKVGIAYELENGENHLRSGRITSIPLYIRSQKSRQAERSSVRPSFLPVCFFPLLPISIEKRVFPESVPAG